VNPAPRPSRILVYGVTGSGKTTLAELIGVSLGLPWHPVDDLTWEAGWVGVPDDVQRARVIAICERDEWVLDAGYSGWIDVPLSAADLVVGLDFPRWVSLRRLLWRTVKRVVTREPICNGNRESMRQVFSRDSIIAWHFRSFARKRRQMREWAAGPSGDKVLLFRSPAAVARWLRTQVERRSGRIGPAERSGRIGPVRRAGTPGRDGG
jgi:adenylate kinase family enzyme